MDAHHTDTTPPASSCIDCGAPVSKTFGGISICDTCLELRGSCCPEFGASDLTTNKTDSEYASPACSAHLFEEADSVQHRPNEKRFLTTSGAYLDYSLSEEARMNIYHTYVPPRLRGKGLAGELMKAAIRYAQQEELQLHASCDYADTYLKRAHPSNQ